MRLYQHFFCYPDPAKCSGSGWIRICNTDYKENKKNIFIQNNVSLDALAYKCPKTYVKFVKDQNATVYATMMCILMNLL